MRKSGIPETSCAQVRGANLSGLLSFIAVALNIFDFTSWNSENIKPCGA